MANKFFHPYTNNVFKYRFWKRKYEIFKKEAILKFIRFIYSTFYLSIFQLLVQEKLSTQPSTLVRFHFLALIALPLPKPAGKHIGSLGVSPVMMLGELLQHPPGEVRVSPRVVRVHELLRRPHNLVLLRAQEEHQRLPRCGAVHHCPVLAALVPLVCQCLFIKTTHLSVTNQMYIPISVRFGSKMEVYHESIANIDDKGVWFWADSVPLPVDEDLKATNIILA